jgi:hypothetical protein
MRSATLERRRDFDFDRPFPLADGFSLVMYSGPAAKFGPNWGESPSLNLPRSIGREDENPVPDYNACSFVSPVRIRTTLATG